VKPRLVEVHWLDARTVYETVSLSRAKTIGLRTRVTSGYIVRDDTDVITVAHTFDPAEPDDEEDECCDVTVIPKSQVQKVTPAKRKKKEKKVCPPPSA
jgi:hypothetical protein